MRENPGTHDVQYSGVPEQAAQLRAQVLQNKLFDASTITVPIGHEQDPSSLFEALEAQSTH